MTLDTLPTSTNDPTAPKSWTTSRTVIFNVALTIVFALGLVGQLAGAFAIDPKWVALAGAVAAAINFYLRLDTNSAITGTPAAVKAETAKQDIALHAAMNGSTAPPTTLTVDDFRRQIREFQAQRDDLNALLNDIARLAPYVPPVTTNAGGAATVTATAP